MDFDLEYSAEAALQLSRLDKVTARRILDKIDRAKGSPHRFFKRLVGRPEYKLRIGNYRVIAELEAGSRLILIRSIGHRSDIYKRR